MIKIDRIQKEDIPQISEIETSQPHSAHWGCAGLEAEIGNGFSVMLKAACDGETSGFISFRGVPPEGEIVNFAVSPRHTRRGAGAALLAELFGVMRAAGFKKVTLEVNENNLPAVNIYTKHGFRTLCKRIKFYKGREDALLMEKVL